MKLLDSDGGRILALLLRLTLRHDVASDLLQDLFVRLSSNDGFDRVDDPAGYAWRTAINLAMDWRRSNAREQKALSINLAPAEAPKSPLDRLIDKEHHTRLLDRLSDLSANERECFVLRFIEQQPYERIAKQMSRTPHQVRGLCHAAARRLREALGATPRQPTRSPEVSSDV